MKKKYIILIIFLLFAVAVYILFFYKDKNLKYIPENADIIVLLDTKRVKRQYITSFLQNPSEWFKQGKQNTDKINLGDSGIKIPDYFQIFHLRNSKISEWYTVFEINDKKKLLEFLKRHKFISNGKDRLENNQLFIKIEGEKCVVGTSDAKFDNIEKPLNQKLRNNILNADSFMDNDLGSISFISELRTQNFSIDLNDNDIEIKNTSKSEILTSLLTDLKNKTEFLEAELDAENIEKFSHLFNENFNVSANINYLKMSANIEEVNDTIVSYGYDDNFNEIEKISYQKIVQPNYEVLLQSSNPEKTWSYFQNKKWINTQNQFTAIPFQPNLTYKNKNEIVIKSIRKSIKANKKRKNNFIFVRNNPLLYSSLKTIAGSDKKFLKDIEYLFYGNQSNDSYFKIEFRKQELPLILR